MNPLEYYFHFTSGVFFHIFPLEVSIFIFSSRGFHEDGIQYVCSVRVVVVVVTLKTVLTSIQYLIFFTLQGKEANFRGNKLTQNKVRNVVVVVVVHIKNRSDLYPIPSL